MADRKATKYPGVYERNLENQTFKSKPDIVFDITYRHEGRKIWEKVGRVSEGYSAKLASDIRAERIHDKRHGQELPYQKKLAPTFKKLAEKYLKWSAETKNRAGIEDKSRYEKHLRGRFDDKRLDAIVPLDLERMKSEMSKELAKGKKKKISPKTISHCLALIRAMYNKAAVWNIYQGENPVKKVNMPVVQNSRDRFFSIEEAELLLKELKRDQHYKNEYRELEDPRLHDIALLSLHTGARAGEIFNLKGQDIDFDNELIALRDTKNTETRYAPMTKDIRKMLKRRMPEDPGAYIFTDKNGKKIKEVSNSFERIIGLLGFNDGVDDPRQRVVFHTCRHTFASWLAIQGTPLYTIAKLIGHKTPSMTMRYSHLSPDHKKEAVRGIEKAFRSKKNIINIDALTK